jgi:creatinine amidohydrolase
MPKVRYEEMLPHEVVEAREKCPVAYIPIGGIEWHGEHNCLGLDTVKAHALAMRCAEVGGGVAMPALFWGENRESHLMEANGDPNGKIAEKMHLPHENFRPGYMQQPVYDQDRAYVELLFHILRQLESLGFEVIVFIAGHYPLLRHARAACDWYSLDGKSQAWAVTGYELVRDQIPDAGDHAAGWETSLMMALRPELVDLGRLPEDRSIRAIGTGGARDPRDASVEYGRQGVDAVVTAIVEGVRQRLPKK